MDINSYSRVINNPDRLKSIKDHNEICAYVAEVSTETENERSREKIMRGLKAAYRHNKKAVVAAE